MSPANPSPVGWDSPPHLIDTHCHLDDDDFAGDLDLVLERSARAGVSRWINVGYRLDRWPSTLALARAHPGMSCMVGIHPGYAGEWSHGTAAELRRVVTTGVPLAIGEIGLDFYRGETNVAEQVTAFTGQLALAREFDLPACIHMRNAEDMVIEVLSEQPELPVLLFHSFDGSPRLVRWILEHDAWIGVGGLATRPKSAELRSNIARVGLERIVLETDSPFLVPTGFKHRRNTPESIPLVAHTVAEVFGVDWSTVARCTTENALRVFRKLSAI